MPRRSWKAAKIEGEDTNTNRLQPSAFAASSSAAVAATLMRSKADFAPQLAERAAAWITESQPRVSVRGSAASSARSAATNVAPLASIRARAAVDRPVATTAWPRARAASTRLRPSPPVAPVIRIVRVTRLQPQHHRAGADSGRGAEHHDRVAAPDKVMVQRVRQHRGQGGCDLVAGLGEDVDHRHAGVGEQLPHMGDARCAGLVADDRRQVFAGDAGLDQGLVDDLGQPPGRGLEDAERVHLEARAGDQRLVALLDAQAGAAGPEGGQLMAVAVALEPRGQQAL